MIVSEKNRYVFVAIPKTGSASIVAWLRRYYDGRSVGGYHDWRITKEFSDFTVFTVVRNPYERCFSWWWFKCMDISRMGKSYHWGYSFRDFMASIIEYRDNNVFFSADVDRLIH